MKDYLYIFLHLPKTGGTTFSQHIENNLKNKEIFSTSRLRYDLVDSKIDKNKIKVVLGHASYYGIHKLFPNKIPRYIVFLRDPAERLVSSYNFEMRTKKGKNVSFWNWYNSQLKNEIVYFLDMKFKGKEGAKANLPRKTLPFFSKIFKSKKVFFLFQKTYEKYISTFGSSKRSNEKKLKNSKLLLDKSWHIGLVSDLDKSLKYIFREMGLKTKWKDKNITKSKKNFFKLDEASRRKIYLENKYDKELFDYAILKNKK